jgi:multiple sugar transport system permease protein
VSKRKAFDIDKYTPVLMLLPALIAICIVQLYPCVVAIGMSFFDINLLKPTRPFIGFDNYAKIFEDPVNMRVMLNTLVWAIVTVVAGSFLSLCVAVQLNKPFRSRALFRVLFLAPWVTPPIVIASIWKLILNRDLSPISTLLMNLHLVSKPVEFLSDPTIYFGFLSIPMIYLIIVNIWSFMPFAIVMFLSGLQTVPTELYEAATVDGASKTQQFRHITIPMLMPVMETIILLQGIWQFNNFNLSYLVTHGGPLNSTELMAVRVYIEAMNNFRYGYGASISVVMVAIVIVPTIIYIRKVAREESRDIV